MIGHVHIALEPESGLQWTKQTYKLCKQNLHKCTFAINFLVHMDPESRCNKQNKYKISNFSYIYHVNVPLSWKAMFTQNSDPESSLPWILKEDNEQNQFHLNFFDLFLRSKLYLKLKQVRFCKFWNLLFKKIMFLKVNIYIIHYLTKVISHPMGQQKTYALGCF